PAFGPRPFIVDGRRRSLDQFPCNSNDSLFDFFNARFFLRLGNSSLARFNDSRNIRYRATLHIPMALPLFADSQNLADNFFSFDVGAENKGLCKFGPDIQSY